MTDVAATRTLRLEVRTAPTTHALAALVAVLHHRGVHVEQLRWSVQPAGRAGRATLLVDAAARRHPHLREALGRLVDVTAVDASGADDATAR